MFTCLELLTIHWTSFSVPQTAMCRMLGSVTEFKSCWISRPTTAGHPILSVVLSHCEDPRDAQDVRCPAEIGFDHLPNSNVSTWPNFRLHISICCWAQIYLHCLLLLIAIVQGGPGHRASGLGWTVWGIWPGWRARNFLFCTLVHTSSRADPASCTMGNRTISRGSSGRGWRSLPAIF